MDISCLSVDQDHKECLKNLATDISTDVKSRVLTSFQAVNNYIKKLDQINIPQDDASAIKFCDDFRKILQSHAKATDEYQLYRNFIIFVIIAAFQTANTIISRLADTPTRKLGRRLKYASSGLRFKSDGSVAHNFIHNVGNVTTEYITILEQVVPKYMGKSLNEPHVHTSNDSEQITPVNISTAAPYFQLERETGIQSGSSTDNLADLIVPETMKNDQILTDVYSQVDLSMSPCGVHDGTKLRTDCILCKAIVAEEDKPIGISKAFLRKLNVTENLLKFLFIQQEKRNRESP